MWAATTGWSRAGLLKIDVEGAELEVLHGAVGILHEQRPRLLVETHSPALERACGDLLLGHGYAPRVVTPRRRLAQRRPREHNRWLVA
jgi:Methyltransferase FkbM domain